MAESSKKTRGRQHIEIKKIENENDRLITFSKRKSGIYKKLSEIVTLTGSEVGAVVFSPSGKPYSFGHPSIESISNRFLGANAPVDNDIQPYMEAQRQMRINELTLLHNDYLDQLKDEKERGKVLMERAKGKRTKGWWEAPIEELNIEDLKKMDSAFDELSKTLHNKLRAKSLSVAGSSSSSLPPLNPQQPGIQFPGNLEESHLSTFPHGHEYGSNEPGKF